MSKFSVGLTECEIAGGPLSDQTLHEKWMNGIPIIEVPAPLQPSIRKDLISGNLYQLRPSSSEEDVDHVTYSPVKSQPIIVDPDN